MLPEDRKRSSYFGVSFCWTDNYDSDDDEDGADDGDDVGVLAGQKAG